MNFTSVKIRPNFYCILKSNLQCSPINDGTNRKTREKKNRSRTDFCRQVIGVLYKRRTVPQAVHVYVTSLIMV